VGGNVSGAFTVTLGSVLGTGTLSGSDAAWLQLAAAQGIATAQVGPNLRVLAGKHAVGSGKSLTLGWDGENTGSSALYRAALDAVTPSGNCALLPAGAADVRVQVANTGVRSTSYTVDHTLAAGLTTSEPLQHTLVISAAQSGEFNLPLRLPNATGSFQVSATLQAEGQQLDSDVLVINVEQSAVTLSSSLLSALQALTLDAADSNRRSSAIGMIQSAASRSNAEDAIGDVLSAIDKVRPITSANVTAVRIDLARLLRIYQLRWVP
jgi:hypothetical protein